MKVLRFAHCFLRLQCHRELLPEGRTDNKEYYFVVMRRLREVIRKRSPDLWQNNSWLLHHDNAPAHTSLLIRDFLAQNNSTMMPQPSYSPDLAPMWLFLVPKTKETYGRPEIKTASLEERAQGYTEKCLWEVLRGLEKA